MQLGFYFDQTRCTGCFACCVACKDWHDIPAGPARWIRIETLEEGKFPDLFVANMSIHCFHCQNPACIAVCPADAIIKRGKDGIVLVDGDACLGESNCGACKDACPYDAPQFAGTEDDKMQKCDLCLERWQKGRKPICVEACPMRALDAGPLNELENKYGDFGDASGFVYHKDMQPSVIVKNKLNI